MPRDIALALVNGLHAQMATLARSVVTMLADKRVSPWEVMQISMQAMQLGTYVLTVLQGCDAETKKDLLYVLEHGRVDLPAATPQVEPWRSALTHGM